MFLAYFLDIPGEKQELYSVPRIGTKSRNLFSRLPPTCSLECEKDVRCYHNKKRTNVGESYGIFAWEALCLVHDI